MEYIVLVKFTEQKCLGYEPALDKSYWVATATFSDGSVRTWRGYLGENETFPLDETRWIKAPAGDKK